MNAADRDIKNEEITFLTDSIRAHSKYDFSNYSVKSLKRRFVKILSEHNLTVEELENKIVNNPVFMEKIVKNITVNTTELFRDPGTWIHLRDEILPGFSSLPEIKIWHAGCSSGQEVYSMMIILEEMGLLSKSAIYASDINPDMLESAKKGRYRYRYNHAYLENFDKVINEAGKDINQKDKVPHNKYFNVNKVNDSIQMNTLLVKKPVYSIMDLVTTEEPFQFMFDIIICRNVIIYFNSELQNKVLQLFYRNLAQNGCLVLGIHESILGPVSSGFEKIKQVYRKI